MKILLITPLYPPDISEPAPYVKELATRLLKEHTVTILAYNHIPETIPGVTILSIEKSASLPMRLYRFFCALVVHSRKMDILYSQNGPSVELPLFILSFFTRIPIYFRLGDTVPLQHALTRTSLRFLIIQTLRRVYHIIAHEVDHPTIRQIVTAFPTKYSVIPRPLPRPEINPLQQYPYKEFAEYEASWNAHITNLTKTFLL